MIRAKNGEQEQQHCCEAIWELSELHEEMPVSGPLSGARPKPPCLHPRREQEVREEVELGGGDGPQGRIPLPHDTHEVYELGVKYVTIYAFSIDNFKRKPDEVQYVMDLMLEKIDGLLKGESIVNQYGVRVEFIGNLKLLSEPVRIAAEKAMKVTAGNSRAILLIAVAYTSTDEIAHAAQESCLDKIEIQNGGEVTIRDGFAHGKDGNVHMSDRDAGEARLSKDTKDAIRLADVERHMYMGVAPDPDVLVRTSGEMRLSNFLLWQTSNSLLYSPRALWPEMGLRHLVYAVLNFQRVQPYLERRRKLL